MESIKKDSKPHVNAFLNGAKSFMIGHNYRAKAKHIGIGSSAAIYHAIEVDRGREVAIKTIKVPDIRKLAENVTREIKVWKELKHPNIIRLYDIIYDKDYDNVHLVMEYAPNGTLADYLKKQKTISEIYAKVYMRQLAKALKYIIRKGYVHRDLKPQNILMFGQYGIKLSDFGFATKFDPKNDLLNTFCGTPLYMAPELFLDKEGDEKKKQGEKNYDSKADLWSIGIILYEMLSGKIPSYTRSIHHLPRRLQDGDFRLPASIKVTPECRNLLEKLLVKDPDQRITWDQFFNHPWFYRDEIMERDNQLIEMADNLFDSQGALKSLQSSIPSSQNSTDLLNKFSFNRTSTYDSRLPAARPKKQITDLHDSFQELKKSFYTKKSAPRDIPISKKEPEPSSEQFSASPDLLSSMEIRAARHEHPSESFDEFKTSSSYSDDEPENDLFYSCEYTSDYASDNEVDPKPSLEMIQKELRAGVPFPHPELPKTNIPIEKSQICNLLDTELSQKLDQVMVQLNQIWNKKKALEKTEQKMEQSYNPELSFGQMIEDPIGTESIDQEYQMVNLSFQEDYFASSHEGDELNKSDDDIVLDERGKYVVISTNPINIQSRSDITNNRATYQDGFKYYLNNSINFLKESYTYFANNRKSI